MKALHHSLYAQVLVAVALGILLGWVRPDWGAALGPLGEAFIRLVRMLVAPIVFLTVVLGIARMGDLKKVGRVGAKGLLYFEVLSTLALAIGLLVAHGVRPGAGMGVDPATLDTRALATLAAAPHPTAAAFLLNVIPRDVMDAFARGDILQVLLFSLLFGTALAFVRTEGTPVMKFLEALNQVFFRIVAMVMRLAPLGAFGAMAFTVGTYGLQALANLGKLVACFYAASALFVLLVLGLVLRRTGLGILKFLRYLREEILIVLGTSSSESALPLLMEKLERLGCSRPVVGLVIPMGYSFNLDGTSIYLTLAALFVAQATGTPLTWGEEITLLATLLLTSKGAAAVSGGGFVTLAATLAATGPIPVAGLALLLGVDRFMSEARAVTNLIGNAVAAVAVSRWEGELDLDRARLLLDHPDRVEEEEYQLSRIPPGAGVPEEG